MTRLFWKLFLALWLSIVGFIVLLSVINNRLNQQHIPDSPEVAFNRSAQKAEVMLQDALDRGGSQAARKVLRALPTQFKRHVYVFDETGAELLDRNRVREHLESAAVHHRETVLQDSVGNEYRLLVLRRAAPARVLEPGRRGVLFRLLFTVFVAALVSFFLARYLARPLEQLGRTSRQLATGDLTARVGAPLDGRRDEFGALARDLDDMASHLDRLHRANRRLLRDVSHELRSPLARLRVALELARSRDTGAVRNELQRIGLEGERLENLVEQVLDLLRETSGSVPLRLERFDLSELLEDLHGVVSYEIAEGDPDIELELTGRLPVEADRELLWRTFENLLRNAIIHSDGAPGLALVARHVEDGRVEVRVQDGGPGVPGEQLDKLFDPFYRVDESREPGRGGYGLGLAIAAAAVRRHQGHIEGRNRPRGGFEVVVSLPSAA